MGYISEKVDFREIITDRDRKLWKRIINNEHNSLQELLPNKINRPLRQRGHEFELPLVRTERYKRSFINTLLSGYITTLKNKQQLDVSSEGPNS
jgi:hypothetical protein